MSAKSIISTTDLSYTQEHRVILESISVAIPEGSMTMIIGPNGAGKTTLIRLILGLLTPTSGTVLIAGMSPAQARSKVGYVPQRFAVDATIPITVSEFLTLTYTATAVEIKGALAEVGLAASIARAQLATLSGGQLQRVLIARAILGRPEILVLDEPVSNVDAGGTRSIYDHLEHLRDTHNMTIIVVSHEMDIVSRYASFVVCVNRSILCTGTAHEVLKSEAMHHVYGEGAKHFHHHEHS
ncbi:MAG: metal ABC transporter ATP-binding protein [Patescibacteria group bacterium]